MDLLCSSPFIFMICCAQGAKLMKVGGRYHEQVTPNDECRLVATMLMYACDMNSVPGGFSIGVPGTFDLI